MSPASPAAATWTLSSPIPAARGPAARSPSRAAACSCPASAVWPGSPRASTTWPRHRDVALIATAAGEGTARYQQAAGRDLDPAVITLYRARWYLDDLASAIRMF